MRLRERLEYEAHTRYEHMGGKKKMHYFQVLPEQAIYFQTRLTGSQTRKKLTGICPKALPILIGVLFLIFHTSKKQNHKISYPFTHSYLDLAKSTLYTDCSSAESFNWCNCVLRWGRDTWSKSTQDQMYVVQKSYTAWQTPVFQDFTRCSKSQKTAVCFFIKAIHKCNYDTI